MELNGESRIHIEGDNYEWNRQINETGRQLQTLQKGTSYA